MARAMASTRQTTKRQGRRLGRRTSEGEASKSTKQASESPERILARRLADVPPAGVSSALEDAKSEWMNMTPRDLAYMLGAIGRQHGRPVNALRALESLASMQAPVANVYAYTAVLVALGRANLLEDATALLARMDGRGNVPKADTAAYNAVLAALAENAKADDAERTLADMKSRNVTRDVYTYTSVVHALGQAGQWQRARALVRSMARGSVGVSPNAVTFSALMRACLSCGEPALAMAAFRDMERNGVSPDAKALTHFFAACRASDPPQGTAALVAFRDATERGGVRPIVSTYNALIAALGAAGLCDEALGMLSEMQREHSEAPDAAPRPNAITYNAAVSACARAGRAADARRVCAQMDDAGISRDAITYAELLKALARGGCIREALAIFAQLRDGEHGVTPNRVVHNVMLMACARAIGAPGEEDAAELLGFVERTVRDMKDAGGALAPDTYTQRAHLLALENANEWARASEVYGALARDEKAAMRDGPLDVMRDVVYRGVGAAALSSPPASIADPLREAAAVAIETGRRARRRGAP